MATMYNLHDILYLVSHGSFARSTIVSSELSSCYMARPRNLTTLGGRVERLMQMQRAVLQQALALLALAWIPPSGP
jgi:hypothetical protein